jgi:GTP cyclohydrolase IA
MSKLVSISAVIKERILDASEPFASNDNISEFIEEGELQLLQKELEQKMQSVLETLIIDTHSDHNTKETAKRVAKMMLHETFSGRYIKKPDITDFPNVRQLDELYTVGPIHIDSACSHHLVPIQGKLWVGIHPSDKVIGLSKFHRLAAWVFRRPQIQEEATIVYADELEKAINPKGLAVVLKANHLCCGWRGVRDNTSLMTTSVVRGTLREVPLLKEEFFKLIQN